MVFRFLPCIPRTSRATRVCAQTLKKRVKLVQSQRTNPRLEQPWAVRGIHVEAGVGGAARGEEENEVDDVVRIRERIWDVRNGGIAVPLPPSLVTTN